MTEPVLAEWGGRVYPATFDAESGIVTIAAGAVPVETEDAK